ncbi:MAG: gluconolaconase [bacterium]|nr:MAG: gluconolaconase [bacterium]
MFKEAQSHVLIDGLAFPEAPRWRNDRLWFTDQHARQIRWVDLNGQSGILAEMNDLPGGLGWLPDGTLLVVAMTSRCLYRVSEETFELYADLSSLASFHCNDMLVDTQGRAYVGNFGYDLHGGAEVAPAELIMVQPDGHASVVACDLIFPNGMTMTPNGELLVAETFAHRLSAFTVARNGQLSGRRTWAELGGATPDGICLDAEGAVWVASPGSGDVLRIREGGETIERVAPVGTPYACMLGGPDRKLLFMLTAETDDPVDAARLRSGRIEIHTVAVAGAGLP